MLTDHVMTYAALLDEIFPLLEREQDAIRRRELCKRAASILNWLELTNDQARYFGLGIDYQTDANRKREHKERALAEHGLSEPTRRKEGV